MFGAKLAAGGRPNHGHQLVGLTKSTPPCKTAMRSAIAFGMVIVILGIFLPGVIHAMDVFLLALFQQATALVNALPAQTATMSQMVH